MKLPAFSPMQGQPKPIYHVCGWRIERQDYAALMAYVVSAADGDIRWPRRGYHSLGEAYEFCRTHPRTDRRV
jgi:hypothetical protein